MRSFIDSQDRTWILSVTVNTIRRVRDLVGVDLMTLITGDAKGQPEQLEKLAADPVLLVDTLYAIIKPQADEAGVSDQQFGESLDGDVLDCAITALLEATIDFFPKGRQTALTKLLNQAKQVDQLLARKLTEQVESIDPTQIAEALLLQNSGSSSGDSPAASDAIPAN